MKFKSTPSVSDEQRQQSYYTIYSVSRIQPAVAIIIKLHSTLLPRGDSLRTLARAPQWQRRLRLLRRRGGAHVRRAGRAEKGGAKRGGHGGVLLAPTATDRLPAAAAAARLGHTVAADADDAPRRSLLLRCTRAVHSVA